MKWLVFSDSHGDVDTMARTVLREKPDRILHLGDMVRGAERLRDRFPDIPLDNVRGNCDFGCPDAPEEKEVFFRGKRLWLVHGHAWGVKMGTWMLLDEARARGVDCVLFGHTHIPLCHRDGSLWVLNPGAAGEGTCGILEERNGELYCRTARAGS